MPDNVERFLEWKREMLPKEKHEEFARANVTAAYNPRKTREMGELRDEFKKFVDDPTKRGRPQAIECVREIRKWIQGMGVELPEWREPPEWVDG